MPFLLAPAYKQISRGTDSEEKMLQSNSLGGRGSLRHCVTMQAACHLETTNCFATVGLGAAPASFCIDSPGSPCLSYRFPGICVFVYRFPRICVLLTTCFAGIARRPSWGLAGVVLVISAGLLMLVEGETKFDAVGFFVVMTASMMSGFRWTITQVLLQGDKADRSAGEPLRGLGSMYKTDDCPRCLHYP
jgi:hypothetical protein